MSTLSKEHESKNQLIDIFILFPKFFADNDQICKDLLDLLLTQNDQNNQIQLINDVITKSLENFQTTQIDQLHLKLKNSPFTQQQIESVKSKLNHEYGVKKDLLEKNSFRTVNNIRLLSAINEKLDLDQSVKIEYDRLLKVFDCLACFEDISIAVNVLAKSDQINWLKSLIVEHISEKFCLMFKNKFSIECQDDSDVKLLHIKLSNIHERLLFVFNNLLANEYVDFRLSQAATKTDDNGDKTDELVGQQNGDNGENKTCTSDSSLKLHKFNALVDIMQEVVFSKELLDQLSSALNLSVWEDILNEFTFNQYFNRKLNQLNLSSNDDSIEKILLYLNRIRQQQASSGEFRCFTDCIFTRLYNNKHAITCNDIKSFLKLVEAIHCQMITFVQAMSIVQEHVIGKWLREMENIKV